MGVGVGSGVVTGTSGLTGLTGNEGLLNVKPDEANENETTRIVAATKMVIGAE